MFSLGGHFGTQMRILQAPYSDSDPYPVEKSDSKIGNTFALERAMKSVIEFPKLKVPEQGAQSTDIPTPKKIFNIADWAPKYQVQLDTSNIDNWPFCAA
jgi:hypothetical protein